MPNCGCDICKKKWKQSSYIIYRFELIDEASQTRAFKNQNDEVERTKKELFYVGMTARKLEDRINQHQNEDCNKNTKWGKKYMVSGSAKVLQNFDLTFLKEKFGTGPGTAKKIKDFVEEQEEEEAKKLRSQGYWAYQS